MTQANLKRDSAPSEVRLVVEVDGNPVGFLNLDIDRLWPLINHRKHDAVPVGEGPLAGSGALFSRRGGRGG